MAQLLIGGLDIETTGLEQESGHRIIEVAAVLHRYDTDTKEHSRVLAWEKRINPHRPIDPEAQKVHGISFEELTHCPSWEDVAPKLAAIMDKSDYLVAHNGNGFDLPFITLELLRIGHALPNVKPIDTFLEGSWATPFGKLPNLGELCFGCDVPYDRSQAHAALYDVDVLMQCFFIGLRKGFFVLP